MSLLEAQRAIATNWLEALPATAAARAADHNAGGTGTDRSASSAAGERSGDHFGFWIQTWWACHRWRPDDAWSVLLDHVRNSGRVQVHCAGSDTQDRRCGRHRVLDWEIGPSTQPGTGSVVVTCNGASTSSPIRIG